MVCGHPLQAAYRNRPVFHPATPACGLTRAVANTTENSRKHVRFSVFDVGVGESSLGNQADILRNIGVRRTSPLTVDNFVEVLGFGGISRFHSKLVPDMFPHPANNTDPYLALA